MTRGTGPLTTGRAPTAVRSVCGTPTHRRDTFVRQGQTKPSVSLSLRYAAYQRMRTPQNRVPVGPAMDYRPLPLLQAVRGIAREGVVLRIHKAWSSGLTKYICCAQSVIQYPNS